MRLFRRIFSGIMLVAVTALGAATSGVALPAQAATPTIYVDNTGHCRNSVPTFAQAVTLAGAGPAKIIVCPGTYTEAITISGTDKITLSAKKGVVLHPPSASYNGALVTFSFSTNATVTGFTIDGNSSLATNAMAIRFDNTSGKILKNTILNWRATGITRSINANSTTTLPLTISKNTLTNHGDVGIEVFGPYAPTISSNTLDTDDSVAIGIRVWALTGGRITGNKISNRTFPTSSSTTGIQLVGSNNVKLTGNRMSHLNVAFDMTVNCVNTPLFTSDFNQFTGNRINEVALPFYISPNTAGGTCAVQANHTTIKANKMIDTLGSGVYGVMFQTTATTGTAHADFEVVTGNTVNGFSGSVPTLVATGAGAAMPTGAFTPNHVTP